MNNKVKGLKGLTPKFTRKDHYIFAYNVDDFAMQTGSKGYIGNVEPYVGRTIAVSDRYTYIWCTQPSHIMGLTNIEVSITPEFKKRETNLLYINVKREIEICNFQHAEYINPENIPLSLRELMAEMEHKPQDLLPMPTIGMVVSTNRNWDPINVKKDDIGIIVSLYGNNLEDCIIIFSNGENCGFSRNECVENLEYIRLTKHQHIRNYQYKNSNQLTTDYNVGDFDAEFYDF